MPLWDFHSAPNAFTPEEKHHIAKSLTPIYTSAGIPAFYVRVRFQENQPVNIYSGGESHDKLVLIQVWHLARTMEDDARKKRFLAAVDKVLTPLMEAKGLDWEYFVTESSRDLWKINGMFPPPPNSAEEKMWAEANKPLKQKL